MSKGRGGADQLPAIRPVRPEELGTVLGIINAGAEAYRGVIPADRWHEPYMSETELEQEIAAGVVFWGYDDGGRLIGVMGVQRVKGADIIRHAYVAPEYQGRGIGGALLTHLRRRGGRRVLIGTWAAAEWAIRFYQRHGFTLVSPERTPELLRYYWNIPERQIETSVVLADAPV